MKKHRKCILFKNKLPIDSEIVELYHAVGKDNRKENKALHKHPYTDKDWYDQNVREYLELLQEEAKYKCR